MHELAFRQIHADFHSSPQLEIIGSQFDKKEWQETLKKAEVESITLFATCHHGWCYYDTKVGERSPSLKFDLLRAEMEACHEIGIRTPVYFTGGLNSYAAEKHADWCNMERSGKIYDPVYPHFRQVCFNTPYLDFLCAEIQEVIENYPLCDGIFVDIISARPCYCRYCMRDMEAAGLDPNSEADHNIFAQTVLEKYLRRVTETVRAKSPDLPLFHNGGQILCGRPDLIECFSHNELESLPTGGWGYDHFPMTAAYARKLGLDFLGMTGKFHASWGDFGGFKHPNALLYECDAMIAQGAKCSVGDQVHPSAKLSRTAYEIIGNAFRDVKAKEPWCRHAEYMANVALLNGMFTSSPDKGKTANTGASRILLEAKIPFDIVDAGMDWSQYKFLIVADNIPAEPKLLEQIREFMSHGGKLIFSGKSLINPETNRFMLGDLPFEDCGDSPYEPSYILADEKFRPDFVYDPFVTEFPSRRIKVKNRASLGKVYDPYFNRTPQHFSGHSHTPYKLDPSEFDSGVCSDQILYFAHQVFSGYRAYGRVLLKQYIVNALKAFLGKDMLIQTDLPSQGRVTLLEQKEEQRFICHLLYANTILRGGKFISSAGTEAGRAALEIIEELNEIGPVMVSLKLPRPIRSVRMVPDGLPLEFEVEDGRVEFSVPRFKCHRMIELSYKTSKEK